MRRSYRSRGSVNAYVTNITDLVLDTNGYLRSVKTAPIGAEIPLILKKERLFFRSD